MYNNKYVFNAGLALVATIILFLINRSEEPRPSWKVYVKEFVVMFLVLVSAEFIRPMVTMTGGTGPLSAPEVDIGNPNF
jgi:hypothetical protein